MTAIYSINAIDSDAPFAWEDRCISITPGAQDSGMCRYVVVTDDPDIEDVWEEDDTVTEYTDVTGDRVGDVLAYCDAMAPSPRLDHVSRMLIG